MAEPNMTMTNGMNLFDKIFSGIFANILIAISILLIGFIIGKILKKLIKKLLHNIRLDQTLRKSMGIKVSLENIISITVSYSIFLISIILSLNQIGVTAFILNIIAASIILLITISIILALKDLVPNFFAGIKIAQKEIVKPGDIISFDKITAKVIEITLTEIKLESKSRDIIFIPNSLLLKKTFKISKRKIIKKENNNLKSF